MKKTSDKITLREPKLISFKVTVYGDKMLQNKMSDEVKEKLEQKYWKEELVVRQKDKATDNDLVASKIHLTKDGKPGLPAIAFKKGMVEMAPVFGITKAGLNRSFTVNPGIIPLSYKEIRLNKAWAKTKGMTRAPKPAVRPEFNNWSCEVTFTFNPDMVSATDLGALLSYAGQHNGVGDWRPQFGGEYGLYKIKMSK